MSRFFGWMLLLGMVAAAAVWFGAHPGYLTLDWLGYRIRMHVGVLAALAFTVLLLVLALMMMIRRILRLPRLFAERARERRQDEGLSAVTETILALASSDPEHASKQLKTAKKFLGERPIVHLLEAQIAYKRDNLTQTILSLKRLLDFSQTRFIASRTLARLSREDGHLDDAMAHAREALRLKPGDKIAIRTLFDLLLTHRQWQEAEQLIRHARRMHRLDSDTASHNLALLYHVQSLSFSSPDKKPIAVELAARAHRQDAAFTPAALHYLFLLEGKWKRMQSFRVIFRSWQAAAHPALAAALFELCRGEPPQKLLKRAEQLIHKNPHHVESQIAAARFALAAEAWDNARNHLKAALAMREEPRLYRMLATLEQKQFDNEEAAAQWLMRAAEAGSDPAWICEACGHRHLDWVLHCEHCATFDSVTWQAPQAHFDPKARPLLLTEE